MKTLGPMEPHSLGKARHTDSPPPHFRLARAIQIRCARSSYGSVTQTDRRTDRHTHTHTHELLSLLSLSLSHTHTHTHSRPLIGHHIRAHYLLPFPCSVVAVVIFRQFDQAIGSSKIWIRQSFRVCCGNCTDFVRNLSQKFFGVSTTCPTPTCPTPPPSHPAAATRALAR